jgi:hypothetical protein
MRRGQFLVLVAALTLAGAGPAAAAIRNLEDVGAGPSSTTASSATAEATCPGAKRALAGGFAVGGDGRVILDDLRPLADQSGFRGQAVKDESAVDSYFFGVHALCASPVPGLERVSATSALNSSNKQVSVTCPAGKRLIGTGAEVNAGSGQVVLNALRPDPGLTTLTAEGAEDQTGYGGPWSITVHGVCAQPLAGLQYVETTGNPSIFGQLDLPCGGGRAFLGTGGTISGGPAGEVRLVRMGARLESFNPSTTSFLILDDADNASSAFTLKGYAICVDLITRSEVASLPSSPPTQSVPGPCSAGGGEITGGLGEVALRSVRAGTSNSIEAAELGGGTPTSWNLRGQGICNPPGVERVSATSPSNSAVKSVTATCPTGKRALSGGGGVSEATGQVFLDDIHHEPGLTRVTATGVEVPGGFSGDWTVTATAFCADPPPGLELVANSSALNSSDKNVTATCPGFKHLVGIGGDINGAGGRAALTRVRPDVDLGSATVRANEDADGYAGPWGLTAYAICVSP